MQSCPNAVQSVLMLSSPVLMLCSLVPMLCSLVLMLCSLVPMLYSLVLMLAIHSCRVILISEQWIVGRQKSYLLHATT